MRKLICFCLCICLMFVLAAGVCASSADVDLSASVTGDGVCRVTQTVTVHLSEAVESLTYPVPANASSVAINGAHVITHAGADCKQISLTDMVGGMVGDCTFTISYLVTGAVTTEPGEEENTQRHILTVPMLSGFSYPIDNFSFTVTMPASPLESPGFTSGYYQESIEKFMDTSVDGTTVSGCATEILKDHETLYMTVSVSDEAFSSGIARSATVAPNTNLLWGLAGIALLFWIVFLRFAPPLGEKTPTAPESINAGELPSVLHLAGADLSLMLFHWGKLGYVKLFLNRREQVTVYKQMDMGNERSDFEQRCFRALFGGRSSISCSSNRYADQFKKVQAAAGRRTALRRSGNPKVFSWLCAVFGGVTGFYIGLSMGGMLRYVWAAVFALLSLFSGFSMQKWWRTLWSYRRIPLLWHTVQAAFWIVLSHAVGLGNVGTGFVAGQLAAGICLAYPGRRTEEGKRAFGQIMGFRRFLLFARREEFPGLVADDGGFYQRCAPYAMAMGIDLILAQKVGAGQSVPYLAAEGTHCSSAKAWRRLMHRTVRAMNRKITTERWARLLQIAAALLVPPPRKQEDDWEDEEDYEDAF